MRKMFTVCVLIVFLVSACASLKPHPRPWTKTEKQCAGFFVLGHVADAFSTEKMLDNPNLHETNPALSEHPSDSNVGIYFSVTGLAILIISHFYPELRKPSLIGIGSLGFVMAIHNDRLD